MIHKLLILLALTICCLQQCPLNSNERAIIYSTERSFTPESSFVPQSLNYRQKFTRELNVVPQVVTTLTHFQSKNSSIIDISIITENIQKTGFNMLVQSGNQFVWTSIKARYLIITNNLFEISHAAIKNPVLDSNGYFYLYYKPRIVNILSESMRVLEFVSSITIQSNGSSYGLKSTKIDIVNSKYQIWYQAITSKVINLELSLVIFDTYTPGFNFRAHAEDIKQFSLSYSMEVSKVEKMGSYLFGFNSFVYASNTSSFFDASLTPQLNLILTSKSLLYLSSSYVFFEQLQCGSCKGYSYFYDSKCLLQCPSETEYHNGMCLSTNCSKKYFQDANYICLPQCPQNQFFNQRYCECLQGFYRINGKCQTCPAGTQYNYFNQDCQVICNVNEAFDFKSRSCQCEIGYLRINGLCQTCPAGTYLNSITQSCEQRCPENSYYNSKFGECSCATGYSWNFDKTECISQTNCQQNERYNFGECVCIQNYYRIQGKCQSCPLNSYFNSFRGFCQCNKGFQLSGNQCTTQCSQQNQVLINGVCRCNQNYTRNSEGICVYNPSCRENEVKVNGKCVCTPNYYLDSKGWCVPVKECRQNQIFINGQCKCVQGYASNQYGICIPISCNQNQQLVNYQCRCKPGYYRNEYGRCVSKIQTCPNNQTFVNGVCECLPGYARNPDNKCYKIQCPFGQAYNYEYKRCVSSCPPLYSWSVNQGKCVPSCQPGYVWNGYSCVCQGNQCCPPGFTWNPYSKQCVFSVQCNTNMEWNGQKCECKDSFILHQNGYCVCPAGTQEKNGYCLTVCPQGYSYINGKCQLPCIKNQIWNGNQCICAQPYNFANGVCVCPLGYREANNTCIVICPHGYQYVNGKCQPPCGPGYIYNGYECICKNNLLKDSLGKCVCPPGTILYNDSCIVHCGPNYQIINGKCVPKCGLYQVWNGFNCVCIQNYTKNNNGVCQVNCPPGAYLYQGRCIPKCQDNQFYNGVSCICKPGYFKPHNICIKDCGQFEKVENGKCVCIDGYYQNQQGACQPYSCPPYTKFNPQSRKCQILCEYPNKFSGSFCICASDFEQVEIGSCLPICKPGYSRGNDGFCTFGCSSTQVLINGVCQCPISYHRVNGICQKCPQDAYLINGNCYCRSNNQPMAGNSCSSSSGCLSENMIRNPISNKCECISGYIWIYGKCQNPPACPANSHWNGLQCVCNYGFIMLNGYCKDLGQYYFCPPNSFFNGVNCQCNKNFYLINGQCSQCPPGTRWTGISCGQTCQPGYIYDDYLQCCVYSGYKCKQNQYWNGAMCICQQNYYWIDHTCSLCPPGSYFDGIQCRLGSANKCNGPYQYWNNNICVCIPGFFKVDESCVTCPQGTSWNGLYCKPIGNLLKSLSQDSRSNSLPVEFRKKR